MIAASISPAIKAATARGDRDIAMYCISSPRGAVQGDWFSHLSKLESFLLGGSGGIQPFHSRLADAVQMMLDQDQPHGFHAHRELMDGGAQIKDGRVPPTGNAIFKSLRTLVQFPDDFADPADLTGFQSRRGR